MAEDNAESAGEDQPPTDEQLDRKWEQAGSDPDLEDDLGYDAMALDVLVTSNSDKKVMFIPRAEEWIRDDAYVIADHDLACDPVERT